MNREQPVSLAVVEAIAKREGIPPEELQPPLHGAIDTDALDSLFHPVDAERLPSAVEFTYNGYTVHVDGSGEITLEPVSDDENTHAIGSQPNDVPYC
ncbi:HalOD1 output domain-containing protein [Natrarchaeobius sp. A-rgal3]|uniref:HalOD1 output domain-containing protein n=1 Tax=Natrarchaeobius versutus TaxID=1679078 RepID=UPI00351027DA